MMTRTDDKGVMYLESKEGVQRKQVRSENVAQSPSLQDTPAERLHKLAMLKQAVDNGTYYITSGCLAGCLMRRMLRLQQNAL